MPTISVTTSSFLRTSIILHIGMMMGQAGFAAFACFYVSTSGGLGYSSIPMEIALGICGALTAAGIFMSQKIYALKKTSWQSKKGLLDKANAYRQATIIRYAALEIPSLFSIVIFLTHGYYYALIFAGIILGYFILNFPNKQKLIEALEPDFKEQQILEDPNGLLGEQEIIPSED